MASSMLLIKSIAIKFSRVPRPKCCEWSVPPSDVCSARNDYRWNRATLG